MLLFVPNNVAALPSQKFNQRQTVEAYFGQAGNFERPRLRQEMNEVIPEGIEFLHAATLCGRRNDLL